MKKLEGPQGDVSNMPLLIANITTWIMVIQTGRNTLLLSKGVHILTMPQFLFARDPMKNKVHKLKLQAQQEIRS
jgi:hypothetical protein